MADTKTQYLEEPLMKEDKRKWGVAQLQYRRPTELMLYCISLSPFACQIPDLPNSPFRRDYITGICHKWYCSLQMLHMHAEGCMALTAILFLSKDASQDCSFHFLFLLDGGLTSPASIVDGQVRWASHIWSFGIVFEAEVKRNFLHPSLTGRTEQEAKKFTL